ncbi:acyl-[acyl-carrier-protein] thioesterase [Candidatus Uabimicrobium sp. HlEnr_7]|uniref:acyl-[acyl-carrier-protein] thioesterase n=1 Tax=Candidatus Uabimicrobium helgolandensis TaxID=3095367 RepID=UPI00355788D7
MENKIFEHQYEISLFFVNAQKNVGLYQLLNILQDISFRHGASTTYKQPSGIYWVLTRQTLETTRWPKLGDTITIKTWLSLNERGFLLREYYVYIKDEIVCRCSTSVAKLDANIKKIVPVGKDEIQKYTTTKKLDFSPQKIRRFEDNKPLKTFAVRNSDIDFNHHVNNTVYAKWVLDAVSYEKHFKYQMRSYSVNFLAESHLGDEIEIQQNTTESIYQGLRLRDKKIVFTAQIDAIPK